jgi:hypothetical protein
MKLRAIGANGGTWASRLLNRVDHPDHLAEDPAAAADLGAVAGWVGQDGQDGGEDPAQGLGALDEGQNASVGELIGVARRRAGRSARQRATCSAAAAERGEYFDDEPERVDDELCHLHSCHLPSVLLGREAQLGAMAGMRSRWDA